MLTLDLARFVPLIMVMGYAAFSDYKTGQVSNKVWWYTIIGGLLTALETAFFFSIGLLAVTLLAMAGSIILGFLIFSIGGGGADSKALMTLGVSVPLVPLWSFIWPFPLPFLAMFIASAITLPYMIAKKSEVPIWKRKVKFLPFIFIGLIICVII